MGRAAAEAFIRAGDGMIIGEEEEQAGRNIIRTSRTKWSFPAG